MRRFFDSILLALVAYSIAVPLVRSFWPDSEVRAETEVERPLIEVDEGATGSSRTGDVADPAHPVWADLLLRSSRPLVLVQDETEPTEPGLAAQATPDQPR